MRDRALKMISRQPDQFELIYGDMRIPVSLKFEPRTRLTITVYPDKSVVAKAPISKQIEEVTTRIKNRTAWIVKQLEYFEQFHPITPPRRYISGETHYYLGRQYRLRITQGTRPQVKLIGRFFLMELSDPSDREKAKKVMQQWYSKHAKGYLKKRIDKYFDRFLKIGAKEPEIRFRRMKKRWGSCSNGRVILLNTELVKAPIHCIDYVIIHELCHLIYPKHSKGFFQLLSRIIPDWKKRKERLEKVVFL